jgi:hypothetical protein
MKTPRYIFIFFIFSSCQGEVTPNSQIFGIYESLGTCVNNKNFSLDKCSIVIDSAGDGLVNVSIINLYTYNIKEDPTAKNPRFINLQYVDCPIIIDSLNEEAYYWGRIVNTKINKNLVRFRKKSLCSSTSKTITLDINSVDENGELIRLSAVKK